MKKLLFTINGNDYRNGDTITIDGEVFELQKPVSLYVNINCRDLYSCYDNPSTRKQGIWVSWCSWFLDRNCWRFGVSSYNTMMFTINAITYVEELQCDCYLYITPTHNYLSPIL